MGNTAESTQTNSGSKTIQLFLQLFKNGNRELCGCWPSSLSRQVSLYWRSMLPKDQITVSSYFLGMSALPVALPVAISAALPVYFLSPLECVDVSLLMLFCLSDHIVPVTPSIRLSLRL